MAAVSKVPHYVHLALLKNGQRASLRLSALNNHGPVLDSRKLSKLPGYIRCAFTSTDTDSEKLQKALAHGFLHLQLQMRPE